MWFRKPCIKNVLHTNWNKLLNDWWWVSTIHMLIINVFHNDKPFKANCIICSNISVSNEQLQQEVEYTLLKPNCHSWWISKMQSGREEERYAIKFCFRLEKMPCDESWIYCYDLETKRQNSQWKHAGSPRPKKARQSKSNHKLLIIPFFWQHWHDLHALGSHWIDSQQGILCWGFKGVQEEIPLEEASTLQIGSVAFPPGQCTSPQLHPYHRLFDQGGHQDSSSPSL